MPCHPLLHKRLNLFPSQLLGNGEILNAVESNTNMYNAQMGYRVPLSGTTTADTLLPMYSYMIGDSIPQKTPIKSESGLSYNLSMPRKRPRESMYPVISYPTPQINKTASPFSFLGQDLSLHFQQQQLDIDSLISQHMEKVRMELEERRKRQVRRIIEALEGMLKMLRTKEEEIETIGKLNWALEERVKSLCIENQIWRDLAQSNEVTANALRTNLEQVLAAHVKDEPARGAGLDEEAEMDDAQSCCGSNGDEEGPSGRCSLGIGAQDKDTSRLCRNCMKEESCVLLLPCRHLCLCTVCGYSLHSCPICKATKNASFHVNMS